MHPAVSIAAAAIGAIAYRIIKDLIIWRRDQR